MTVKKIQTLCIKIMFYILHMEFKVQKKRSSRLITDCLESSERPWGLSKCRRKRWDLSGSRWRSVSTSLRSLSRRLVECLTFWSPVPDASLVLYQTTGVFVSQSFAISLTSHSSFLEIRRSKCCRTSLRSCETCWTEGSGALVSSSPL